MKVTSLRLRLLAIAITSILATLAVAGISLVFLFERQLLRYTEQDLDARWAELAAAFVVDENGRPRLNQTLNDPRYLQPYGGAYWQVSGAEGALMRSRSLWDEAIDTQRADAHGSHEAFEAPGHNGTELYVIERSVTAELPSGSHEYRLTVAIDHNLLVKFRDAFGWDVAKVLIPIALVLVLAAWAQLRLGLMPLRALGAELNAVRAGRAARLSDRYPIEVASLVESLNKLLERQEQLVRKARDRAGTLAHGLKTPLTVLSAEVHRIEQHGLRDTAARVQEQLASVRVHVDRELARTRACGASVAAGAHTSVEETVDRLLRLMQLMPRGDQIIWRTEIAPEITIHMEPDDFGEVVGNLLDNARKWASTTVIVRAEQLGHHARISVEDDGPGFPGGIADFQAERVASGSGEQGSTGLGLGIVREVLSEYGITPVIAAAGRCRVSFEVQICEDGVRASAEATSEG